MSRAFSSWGVTAAFVLAAGASACGAIGDDEGGSEDVTAHKAGLVAARGNCQAFADDAICACTNTEFLGTCKIFGRDTRFFMNLSLAPHQAFNDTISSVIIGPGAKAKFCQHPGGAGTCKIEPGVPGGHAVFSISAFSAAGLWPGGLDNQISSIRIDGINDDCQNPGPAQAAIFEDPHFNNFGSSTRDCVVLDVGTYPHPFKNASVGTSGGGYGLNTDVITSVLSGGVWVKIFEHPDFNGLSAVTNADLRNLSSLGMDDKTSSIIVSFNYPQ
jgi:hypothetical protein